MAQHTDPAGIPLICQIARGDKTAFARFYDLYSPLAFAFALRLLRNRTEAEDLLQEVFVQVWKSAASYDPARGNPEAWISTVTRSRAIDKLRSRRRRDGSAESMERHLAGDRAEAGQRRSSSEEARGLTGGALSKLPEDQRKTLELCYFEGMTHEEISVSQGVPLGTVKTRVRAGLQKLREWVADDKGKKE